MSRIAVVLATHNGARHLSEQLRSIAAQTRRPDLVVVADDASTDATLALVERELEGALPFTVLTSPTPLGVRGNFSRALDAAALEADVLILSDQDDRWYPNRVAAAADYFDTHPDVALVFGDADLIDDAGTRLPGTLFQTLPLHQHERDAVETGRAFEVFLRRNLATGMTMAFRADLWRRAAPIPEGWIHDEWLAVIAAAETRIGIITDPLVEYRLHASNQIGVSRPTLRRKLDRVLSPRGNRNRGLRDRTAALVAHLDGRDSEIDASIRAAARGKLRIETFRAELPDRRIRRFFPVLREATRGDYARFTSQGNTEILRDLFQPR
ncbi:glycosyltransferase involved in cell wall biosynthesis [Mycetocola sp. BIGb0189]|uniref:glycosyltransferase n=1 Tax=Mycetocola sp. BIGb0189 TaxID=2940604 RepID=UPI00216A7670|nr:glycosyltransferase [Mycetocola sp. BIGb0189]MCS4276773.1 glycosyltransferase involved in cell wall biosynthesis [Mycetocola sp. BIGb0189]